MVPGKTYVIDRVNSIGSSFDTAATIHFKVLRPSSNAEINTKNDWTMG
jgi:hypothetical protein